MPLNSIYSHTKIQSIYDRLERARVQATDRLVIIQSIGRLIQQAVTTITFSVSIVFFLPGCCFC